MKLVRSRIDEVQRRFAAPFLQLHDSRLSSALRLLAINDASELLDSRIPEQFRDTETHSASGVDLIEHPHDHQRMPTQIKKVVECADVFDAKHVSPDFRHGRFGPRARRHMQSWAF